MNTKSRIIYLFFIIVFSCAVFAGCKSDVVYPFAHDISQIIEIKIGIKREESVDSININDRYTIKNEIKEKDEFIKDFEKLKFSKNFPGDPIAIKPNDYAIIFIYKNGDSEEVHWGAQLKKLGGYEKSGRIHCDEVAFNELISKWSFDL